MKRKRSVENLSRVRDKRPPTGAATLQRRVTLALTRALFIEWARHGYGELSLEAVVKRAGVGKAALYRRWPSKLAIVADCLERVGIAAAPTPDTGSLVGDLEAMLITFRKQLRHRVVRRVIADLHAEMTRNSPLAQRVRQRLQKEHRERGEMILRRAMARGEISADTNLELVKDATAAMLYWRLVVLGKSTDDEYLQQLIQAILLIMQGIKVRNTRQS